ncbi:acyl carrier protein [Nocardia sp. NBC_00508]|uniref:acyl carrier protein n=1 Tax=Nocardia sp. NBC_00508 TaxID=2975992 RepID=UPI002E807528|nr:acyl carrier protein [Nocardia sp. NBC_00508]WUD66557.1 acyl carrier protein [Nocardia sp. NBC_00508]
MKYRPWHRLSRPTAEDDGAANKRRTRDIERFVGQFISRLIGEELDDDYASLALVNLGLDSVGAIDLGAAIEQEFGVETEPADIKLAMTVAQLAKLIQRRAGGE